MLHRKKNQKRAEVQFKQKFQQSQQNAIHLVCRYIAIVFVFFMLMYIFMRSVSSIPFGTAPSQVNGPNINDLPIATDIALKPKEERQQNIQSQHTENSNRPSNDYVLFKNYMATQVNGVSKGLFEKFEARHEHNLVQLYCDSLKDECIGYAFNKNGGYQFYSANGWPVSKKQGWDFYMKHDPNKPLILKGRGLDPKDMDHESKKKYETINVIVNEEQSIHEDKDPDPRKLRQKKYISYAQNVGRVNNQLVSFEAMIQYALYYNRTLVIPWPRHPNHVMGFECGFWDFDRLREIIDVIMEDALPDHLQKYREEDGVPRNCRYIKLVGKGIPPQHNSECEMIYLFEGDMGIFHFRDGPQDVMKYIVPAPYIRDAVETFLMDEFGELKYRIGVHRRAMKEGGVDPNTGDVHVCRWESRGIHGDSRFGWLRSDIKRVSADRHESNPHAYDEIIAIYHHSCAMDFYDLQNILMFHKQEAIAKGEKFFIAHDHQEQFVIDAMKKEGGIEQPQPQKGQTWSNAENAYVIHREKCHKYGHCSKENTLRMKEEILWDMWALYYADFLVGTWMSTLTRTVCHWKGFERSLYNGNQCFLKWKWQNTVDGINAEWYTLHGLNQTALFD